MFVNKLDNYEKSCKWLKFLLNIWWPLVIFLNITTVIDSITNWSSDKTSVFLWALISCVVLFCANLFTRFLDKFAFIVVLSALAFRGCYWIHQTIASITSFIAIRQVATNAPPADTGMSLVDQVFWDIGNMASDMMTSAISGVVAILIFLCLLMVGAVILSVVYMIMRKDLFLKPCSVR